MTAREVKIILDALPDSVLDAPFCVEEYGEPTVFNTIHLIPNLFAADGSMMLCCGLPYPPAGAVLLEPIVEPPSNTTPPGQTG